MSDYLYKELRQMLIIKTTVAKVKIYLLSSRFSSLGLKPLMGIALSLLASFRVPTTIIVMINRRMNINIIIMARNITQLQDNGPTMHKLYIQQH